MKTILLYLISFTFLSAQPLDDTVSKLSNYILSDKYLQMQSNYNDLVIVDSLYNKALKLHEGNVSEALLTTTFATLAFYELPLSIPIIDLKLNVPLMHVKKELFDQKIDRLPRRLFFDSAKSKFGDLDKISHFFGSAYLANSVTMFNLSKFMGIFIELFEAAFKVEGFIDFRDMIVNNLGELYGASLNNNPELLPSQALKFYNLFYFRITN